ncbi:hypothetical protein V2J93_17140 [Pseudomonas alliivorans]|nr:hypothetical protein [Pseudomonas alliivorans]
MNHKFKPGDLALVIKSRAPQHIGRCVEVLGVLIDDREIYQYLGETHEGAADFSLSAFIRFDDCGVWMIKQSSLMPLRGNFAPEQQKAKEAEPCA